MSKLMNWSRTGRQNKASANGSIDQLNEKDRMGRDAAARWLAKNEKKPSKYASKGKRK